MRRDLIIGLIVSLAIHGGAAWLSQITGHSVAKAKPREAETVVKIEMPPIEPDEPEKIISDEQPDTPPEFAPPTLADVPQVVQIDSFVQPLQPPPPDNLKPNAGAIVIPQGAGGHGLGKGIEVFDISKLDQVPVAKFQARPQYPFEMRRSGVAGEVVVDFIVDTNGDVRNAYSARSSQREFEAAAVQAVTKWKFRPGKKGGRAVNTHMQVPIVFTLNEE
ncbi:MAG: TonB family protein [Verrucomicrobia bacterium]|nr:TonB family protein [Verrucomicrobiota bacterium]